MKLRSNTVLRPKFEIRNSSIKGKGLFAMEEIRKGETVITWHPKILTLEEALELPMDEQKHYLYLDGDRILWMQPPERYMNHSCDANTHVVGMSDVALRNICPNEEITSDYLDLGVKAFECLCGSKNCKMQGTSQAEKM